MLYDEHLIDERSRDRRLSAGAASRQCRRKYPKIIKDVRGKGFMVGLEFHDFSPDAADGAEAGGERARRQAEGLAVGLRRGAAACATTTCLSPSPSTTATSSGWSRR